MRRRKRILIWAGTALLAVAVSGAAVWWSTGDDRPALRPQDIWKAYPLDSSEGQPGAPTARGEQDPQSGVKTRGRPVASDSDPGLTGSSLLIATLLAIAVMIGLVALVYTRRVAAEPGPPSDGASPEPPNPPSSPRETSNAERGHTGLELGNGIGPHGVE
jgi:hypothetical protein